MDHSVSSTEDMLAYRSLRRILASKPKALWAVGPADSARTALRIMADQRIGFVVVLEQDALVGVLTEQDCAPLIARPRKPLEATLVSDIMVRRTITVDSAYTFADCLRLMHHHGVRHLPVVDDGKVVGVISIRDLLSEAAAHFAKIIAELKRKSVSIVGSAA
jgi:predicted transcriptional regulator